MEGLHLVVLGSMLTSMLRDAPGGGQGPRDDKDQTQTSCKQSMCSIVLPILQLPLPCPAIFILKDILADGNFIMCL